MDASLRRAVEALLSPAGGQPAAVERFSPTSGGSIHQTGIVHLRDGRRFFLKSNPAPLPGIFEREAAGLAALAAVGTLPVPRGAVASGGRDGVVPFLLMEAIAVGRPGPGFFEGFGRRLALLHQQGQGKRYGFDHDNDLGATPQPNSWCDDWVEFWRRHRLGHQLALARRRGLSDPTLERLGDRLLDRLGEWLTVPGEPPCLLHGDLWGGNYLVRDQGAGHPGEPVLIDPAVYYGQREADLAMTHLFGGFPPAFYAACEEVWPLPPGSRERLEIYQLYHLLNHLNLFGSGYREGCLAILRRLVGGG